MKKVFLMALLFVMVTMNISAQDKKMYGNFDFEIGVDVPVAASAHVGKTNAITPLIYFEGRWQLREQPIDVGFHIGGITEVKRNNVRHRTIPVLAVADWQFGRGKKINPYVGLGAGVSFNKKAVAVSDYREWDLAVAPRVGVRFFKFINLSAGWLVTHKDYSRIYYNLGFYF